MSIADCSQQVQICEGTRQRCALSLPLSYVVEELWHVSIFCSDSSHRLPCRNELVAVLVTESLGGFSCIKFFACSAHKMEVSRGAGDAAVWRSLASLLVEGVRCAMTEEEGCRERALVRSRQRCSRGSAGPGQQDCEES